MKKLIYLIVLALILGLVLTGCSLLSNISQVPATGQSGVTYLTRNGEGPIILYAGQDIPVGTVEVTDDGENLCIQYQLSEDAIAEGWGIYETHLAVATSIGGTDGIPVNKPGNPQVGQFPYGEEGLEGVTTWPVVPLCLSLEELGAECDDILYIAAHAKIMRPVEDCWDTVWQIGDVEESQLDNPCDEFNYDTLVYGTQDFYFGTTPTNEFPWVSRLNRNYAPIINIYFNAEILFGGRFLFSWSPGGSGDETIEISLDGMQLGTVDRSGDVVSGWWDGKERFINSLDVPAINAGDHVLTIEVPFGDGLVWDWIRLEKPCVQEESAWGDGDRFVQKGNWATYFNYTVTCPCVGCPSITAKSTNIEVLNSPPTDVRVGKFDNDQYIRVWKEFEGELEENLYYDLLEGVSARSYNLGDTLPEPFIPAGTPVCIYYVHYDQVGGAHSPTNGIDASITFGDNIMGLIISGGIKGTFADRDLMFDADDLVGGDSGTTYPDILDSNDHARGFDVKWVQNTDNAVFNGATVNFNVWVANAHDSMRVILPLVNVPCD